MATQLVMSTILSEDKENTLIWTNKLSSIQSHAQNSLLCFAQAQAKVSLNTYQSDLVP